jgi:hypothetical protein
MGGIILIEIVNFYLLKIKLKNNTPERSMNNIFDNNY